jgi:transposase-like protein
MKTIRYSRAFKLQAVREVESGELCATEVGRKYGVKGNGTVTGWVRRYGSGRYGRVVRVETPDELSEWKRLRGELRRTKEALADLHLELALSRAGKPFRLRQSCYGGQAGRRVFWPWLALALRFGFPSLAIWFPTGWLWRFAASNGHGQNPSPQAPFEFSGRRLAGIFREFRTCFLESGAESKILGAGNSFWGRGYWVT